MRFFDLPWFVRDMKSVEGGSGSDVTVTSSFTGDWLEASSFLFSMKRAETIRFRFCELDTLPTLFLLGFRIPNLPVNTVQFIQTKYLIYSHVAPKKDRSKIAIIVLTITDSSRRAQTCLASASSTFC